jgi:hypothetical protein
MEVELALKVVANRSPAIEALVFLLILTIKRVLDTVTTELFAGLSDNPNLPF